MQWAMMFFLAGVTLRVIGIYWFTSDKVLSAERGTTSTAGLVTIFTRMVPHRVLRKRLTGHHYLTWVWHIGFVFVLLAFQPHILFIEGLTGLSWPGVTNTLVMIVGAITLMLLIVALIRRMSDPVLSLISTPSDYLTVVITAAPLLTGLLASGHLLLRYENMLAIHILSICLFLVWIPTSKLMHMILFIPSRKRLGDKLAYRGVKA
jgi:nitrate reductase gamma subunit